MSKSIVDTLHELKSQPTGLPWSKILASSNDVAEERVWALYHDAVAEVRQNWGEPELGPIGHAYEGPGYRAGYRVDCPSADDYFRQLFSQALRIGWWNRAGFVCAVMVTGHDANTLQLLQLAVAQGKGD